MQREREQMTPMTIFGEAKLLNISPEKAAKANPSIQGQLEQMADNTIANQMSLPLMGLLNRGTMSQPAAGPLRASNRGFMEEFHKIYHNKESSKERKDNLRSNDLRLSRTGHGSNQIDFNL